MVSEKAILKGLYWGLPKRRFIEELSSKKIPTRESHSWRRFRGARVKSIEWSSANSMEPLRLSLMDSEREFNPLQRTAMNRSSSNKNSAAWSNHKLSSYRLPSYSLRPWHIQFSVLMVINLALPFRPSSRWIGQMQIASGDSMEFPQKCINAHRWSWPF